MIPEHNVTSFKYLTGRYLFLIWFCFETKKSDQFYCCFFSFAAEETLKAMQHNARHFFSLLLTKHCCWKDQLNHWEPLLLILTNFFHLLIKKKDFYHLWNSMDWKKERISFWWHLGFTKTSFFIISFMYCSLLS